MPRPKIVKVKSDLIKRVQYFPGPSNDPLEGTLRVEYQDGAMFNYFRVPYYIYQRVIQAESPGKTWLKFRSLYQWEHLG